MSNVIIMSEEDYNTLKRANEIQEALFNEMELVNKAKNKTDKTIVICESCAAKPSIKDTFKLITNNIDNFEFISVFEMEKLRGSVYKKILVTRTARKVLYNTNKADFANDILTPLEAAGTIIATIDL